MFTGLIETVGRFSRLVSSSGSGKSLVVEHNGFPQPLTSGESVAVNGACLTVAAAAAVSFTCDLLDETLDKTCLKDKRPGDPLNLERALRAGDRLGGHIVSGHVDGAGRISAIRPAGRDRVLSVSGIGAMSLEMVKKGSIAVDGVSLTIVELRDDSFDAHLIPFTWEHTAFHSAAQGQRVNIETDILGKYVNRLLGNMGNGAITEQRLVDAGFA